MPRLDLGSRRGARLQDTAVAVADALGRSFSGASLGDHYDPDISG
jgi:hypothetical protein